MDDVATTDGVATTSPQAHEIRITTHGKIQNWVTFALDFFKTNAEQPLILHTLPAPKPIIAPVDRPAADLGPDEETNANVENANRELEGGPPNKKRKIGISSSTATIPRLVSVVEIIKREYLKTLELESGESLSGLHQYNELGCLEDLGLNVDAEGEEGEGDGERQRLEALALALEGKNHLKQRYSPYMKVTLCRQELPDLAARSTYQPPTVKKLSKSARTRAKKRQKKEEKLSDDREPVEVSESAS